MEIVRWAAQRLGGAIIIIEHDMSLVKELAEVVYVLHNGTLLAKGSVAAIQADSGGARSLCRGREMSASRLAFENVTGGYGSTTIVRDLTGRATAGEALCVLGRNGVGKSDADEASVRLSAVPAAGAFSSMASRSWRSIRPRAGAPA